MNTMIIGSGGREAALAKRLSLEEDVERIVCSPGSAGMQAISPKVDLFQPGGGSDTYQSLAAFALQQSIGLTIVGPEAPLCDGIVDVFSERGLKIVGPNKAAAQIEGSKVFCKQLLRQANIPTADFKVFDIAGQAYPYIQSRSAPMVVKADGLAAGKGVIVAPDRNVASDAVRRIMVGKQFGDEAGKQVVIEDYLVGQECSIIALTDGKTVIPLAAAQDYKPVGDNNEGPNTGGMGCFSPVPACPSGLYDQIVSTILTRTVAAMERAGCPFRGILYAGLMLTEAGPQVLEYNCRFGDPEVQVLLARLNPDVSLLKLLTATTDGTLASLSHTHETMWSDKKAVCVVLATPGYPGTYPKGLLIEGIEAAEERGATVIHAGTQKGPDGSWRTNGGRVLNLVATGDTFSDARDLVYEGAQCITFDGKEPLLRKDIAQRVC